MTYRLVATGERPQSILAGGLASQRSRGLRRPHLVIVLVLTDCDDSSRFDVERLARQVRMDAIDLRAHDDRAELPTSAPIGDAGRTCA